MIVVGQVPFADGCGVKARNAQIENLGYRVFRRRQACAGVADCGACPDTPVEECDGSYAKMNAGVAQLTGRCAVSIVAASLTLTAVATGRLAAIHPRGAVAFFNRRVRARLPDVSQ